MEGKFIFSFATMIDQEGFNELSVTWRIYYSSKWWSKLQWPMTDKFVMGEWPSCRRGRNSATQKCFRWGFQGRILVRSLKLSLFLWVVFISKSFFVSRAFVRFGVKRPSFGAFGFDDILGLFLRTPICHQAFFLRTLSGTPVFMKILY